MRTLFNVNGLVFWSEKEIKMRRHIEEMITDGLREILLVENKAWVFHQIEAPVITPRALINQDYTEADVWVQKKEYPNGMKPGRFVSEKINEQEFVLRPETTPSSYTYAEWLLESNMVMPPFVVWQTGKSFRREQDQVTKNMRLKEFYQQEFQCIYATDTLNEYQEKVLEPLRKLVENILALPTRIVDSERLPSYSLKTLDIEVDNGDKWMEVCSISKRTDFTMKKKFGSKEKEFFVLEVAMGLDRLVYNYFQRIERNIAG
jgi:glycyl-tRNA synthetase